MIKAITIKQPWATLIALGEKKFETRSWATKHRGPIAIHAGKELDKAAFEQFSEILAKHGCHSKEDLPFGAIIATADLAECHTIVADDNVSVTTDIGITIEGQQLEMGYYYVGSRAFELNNIKVLSEPIPEQGQLGLWGFRKKLQY